MPVKDVQTGGVDAAAVVVQSGVASAPELMLGAAQIASLQLTKSPRSLRECDATKKRAGGEAGPKSVGGLNRTRNNRPGLSKPRGAGGLRNPVLLRDRA